jgi:predicted enzyme related to lactoylglutathione lyase
MDHTVIHFEIPANDLQELKKFYSKLFKWKFVQMPTEGMDYWVIQTVPTDEQGMLQNPGVNGGMFSKDPEQKNVDPVNYITVENIDKYLIKATELGGKILMPVQTVPNVGQIARVSDPEGNQFGLLQPERKDSKK